MKNKIIRDAQYQKRIFGYQTAEILGISVSTFTRLMRKEQPEELQKEIAEMILSAEVQEDER